MYAPRRLLRRLLWVMTRWALVSSIPVSGRLLVLMPCLLCLSSVLELQVLSQLRGLRR